ncbi:hypothetical protein H8959_007232 [Pygathrix nigripes]
MLESDVAGQAWRMLGATVSLLSHSALAGKVFGTALQMGVNDKASPETAVLFWLPLNSPTPGIPSKGFSLPHRAPQICISDDDDMILSVTGMGSVSSFSRAYKSWKRIHDANSDKHH